MAYYRQTPDQVEAFQLTPENHSMLAIWCGGREREEIDPETGDRTVAINVPAIDGPVRASEGDYIIKDARGRFTRMSEKAFEAEYRIID